MPCSVGAIRKNVVEVERNKHDLRAVRSSQATRYLFIDDAIVVEGRFPRDSTDQADRLHAIASAKGALLSCNATRRPVGAGRPSAPRKQHDSRRGPGGKAKLLD